MGENYIFHVHTKRCRHASEDADEAYIRKAMELGASSIVFTDHAPFPGNPFTNRMLDTELSEYVHSLKFLKEKYREKMNIHIGLEIEYLPSYVDYYEELKENPDIELLMLGQHHYEIAPGYYNFQQKDKRKEKIYAGLMEAQIEGIQSGFFQVIAHPDRCICRYMDGWNRQIEMDCRTLLREAQKHHVILEQNRKCICQEFWKMVSRDVFFLNGCDAHTINELYVSKESRESDVEVSIWN